MRRFILAAIAALTVAAQEAPPRYDFVLVIDNSISMAERKTAVISQVRELVRSGFAQQMEAGDTLHVISDSAGKEGEGTLSLEWEPAEAEAIADGIAETIRTTRFQRGTRLERGSEQLAQIVPQSAAVLAVVLTDGEEQLTGIGFDAEINRDLPKLRRTAANFKRPVTVSISALEGRWRDWKASTGFVHPRLPRLPARTKPIETPEPTPVAPAVVEQIPAPEPQPAPAFIYPPGTRIIGSIGEVLPKVQVNEPQAAVPVSTPPAVAEVRAESSPGTSARTSPQVPILSPTPEISTSIAASPAPVLTPVAAATSALPVDAPPTNIASAGSNLSLLTLSLNIPQHFETKAAAIETVSGLEDERSGAIGPSSLPYLVASGTGICLLLAGAVLMWRGNKTSGPSLISRSLAK